MKIITNSLLIVLLITTSCRQPKDLVYRNVNNFSVKQAGTEKTTVSLDLLLYNPNTYALKLRRADVDVFMNGNRLGQMTVNEKVIIPKLDTFSLPVMLDVDLKNALPNALQLLLNSNVDIKLTGTIKAGRHGISISIPVNYEGQQDISSGLKW